MRLAAAVILLAAPALADPGTVQTRRTHLPITLDGQLDEPAWAEALPFTGFLQEFPKEGQAPSEPTELRVLYDDDNIYVSFLCRDSRPESIQRKLGARDALPSSDQVAVAFDFLHDHRTAYFFAVNAAGSQADSLFYDDNKETIDWDGVWDAAVAMRTDGWSAELSIPLRIFRFRPGLVQRWGFLALRHLARQHEDIFTRVIPRSAVGLVSRLGHLEGLENISTRSNVELLPYAASRLLVRPQFSDAARPRPRLIDPSLDLGADLRASLTSQLQLNATLNPDFGQVEADQIILNLSNQEAFFPEKRPFFFQGTEIFQPVGSRGGTAPQMLFYSRRIGLTTPILGALKLSGGLGNRVTLGLLDAFVTSPDSVGMSEDAPDRRVRLHRERPLHLAPNDEVARAPAVPENYLAGVLEVKVGTASAVGTRVASAAPLAGVCDEAEAALPEEDQPLECGARGGHAGAVDWNLRTADGSWVLLGQAEASRVAGGPPTRLLPDGVVLARGDAGYGGYLQAGKLGGAPFRFSLELSHVSPKLELNAIGFLPTQNEQRLGGRVSYVRPNGIGKLRNLEAALGGFITRTTDSRNTNRGRNVFLNANVLLPSYDFVGFEAGHVTRAYDVREIAETGIPLERPAQSYVVVYGGTDDHRVASVSTESAFGWHWSSPASPTRLGYTVGLHGVVRPGSRLESRLDLVADLTPHGPRWTEEMAGAGYLFGDLHSEFLSATFRQRLLFSPRLSVQAYGQLFSAFGRYERFFVAASPDGRPIRLADLVPTDLGKPGFHTAGLNVNLVLRWEYRPGATLFAVYTHARESLPVPDGAAAPATVRPVDLFQGPATDGFLVKWSYWWGL